MPPMGMWCQTWHDDVLRASRRFSRPFCHHTHTHIYVRACAYETLASQVWCATSLCTSALLHFSAFELLHVRACEHHVQNVFKCREVQNHDRNYPFCNIAFEILQRWLEIAIVKLIFSYTWEGHPSLSSKSPSRAPSGKLPQKVPLWGEFCPK